MQMSLLRSWIIEDVGGYKHIAPSGAGCGRATNMLLLVELDSGLTRDYKHVAPSGAGFAPDARLQTCRSYRSWIRQIPFLLVLYRDLDLLILRSSNP